MRETAWRQWPTAYLTIVKFAEITLCCVYLYLSRFLSWCSHEPHIFYTSVEKTDHIMIRTPDNGKSKSRTT